MTTYIKNRDVISKTSWHKRGFTLLEVIIYVGIFAVLTSIVLLALYQVIQSAELNRERGLTASESDFAMKKIEWALSAGADVAEPAEGATSTRLRFDKHGATDNPLVFEFASGSIYMERAGSLGVPLTSSRVEISQGIFEVIAPAPGGVPAVRATFRATALPEDPSRELRASTTLTTIIYVRNR